jgi:hypothetical protein
MFLYLRIRLINSIKVKVGIMIMNYKKYNI